MTEINPEDLPADECRRIVADILGHMRHDGLLGEEDALPTGMADRIASLTPKKDPWPLDLGRVQESLTVYPPDDMNRLPLFVREGWSMARVDVPGRDIDRLVVAWLAHRGVCLGDVKMLADGAWEPGRSKTPIRDALRAVLDNATMAERRSQ